MASRKQVTPQGLAKLVRQMQRVGPEIQREVGGEVKSSAEALADKIRLRAPRRKTEPKRRKYASLRTTIRAREESVYDTGARTALGQHLAQLRRLAGISWRVTAGFPARFVEFGTKFVAGTNGITLYKNQKGKWRNRVRKPKRAHHATKPYPFFWNTVQAERPSIVSRVKAAAKRGALAAIRRVG